MNILDYLTRKEKDYLIYKNYGKSNVIFHENDICKQVAFVIKGKVEVTSFSKDGSTITYNVFHENQMFGNNLVFASSNTFKGDVICVETSQIAFINKDQLILLLSNNKDFLTAYLKYSSDFTTSLNEKIKILSFASSYERLEYLLSINDNVINFSGVTNLSKRLFLTREATSRLLSSLTKEGKITKTKNKIYLK